MKNKNKSLIERVKALLSTEDPEVTLAQYEADGIIYEAEELAVDQILYVVGDEENTPAPEGTYVLDGNTVTVGEAGAITAVEPVEVEGTEDTPTEPAILADVLQVNKWSIPTDNTSFEVGETITVSYGEGENISTENLQAGEYQLENGDVIQVDSNGIVVLKTLKAETTPEPVEMAEVTELRTEIDTISENYVALQAQHVELTQTVTELSEVIDELVTVLSEQKAKRKETEQPEEKTETEFREYVNFKAVNTDKLTGTKDRVYQRLFGDQE